ncbi:MAG: hypothetical protein ACJ8BF_11425 [Gemmatimonadales bacterium]
MPRELIERWMQQCIERQGYLHFEDLHVDLIDPDYRPRENWLSSALESLGQALEIRDQHSWPYTVALGMSLVNATTRRGANFSGLNDIVEELDWSPPSLYLFEPDNVEWLGRNQSHELGDEYRPANVPGARAFLREWYDERDREYRRSFWLASRP